MDAEQLGTSRSGPAEIKSFLRRARGEIMAQWRGIVRRLAPATELPGAQLVDHVPDLLDELADLAELLVRDPDAPHPCQAAALHADDRLDAGYDIANLIEELSQLRRCVLTVWQREHGETGPEMIALDLALDRAIEISVNRYVEARERTLGALARLSSSAAHARGLDEMLHALLEVFVEDMPCADVGAIFLLDGEQLNLRAQVGLPEDAAAALAMPIGEGFAGTVAAERRPRELRAAYLDRGVRIEAVRRRHVRALYGIPVELDDLLLGVAVVGSVTAHQLPREERELFGALAALVATGVHDHAERQRLLSLLSHDLRNPLGAVELSATMLLTQLEDHRARKHLEMIQRSCVRMEHLVDDLVDSADIQGGRIVLARERVPADQLVAEALELIGTEAAEHGVTVATAVEVGDAVLDIDRDRLLQALGNVLRFALRRCHAGDTLTLGGDADPSRVRLWVTDTGPALERERLDRMFEPYGAGAVGMYIARGLVEAHGGELAVDGPEAGGAKFLLVLPRVA